MAVRVVLTPLHQAMLKGSLSEMKSLLDNGTSPDIQETEVTDEFFTCRVVRITERSSSIKIMYRTSFANSLDMLNAGIYVIKDGAQNLGFFCEGMTPIFLAIMLGYKPGFELLLEKGADLNKKDVNGNSPLHYAAGSGRFVKELMDSGADFDNMNLNSQTPLFHAILGKCGKALRLLLERGARIDTHDRYGWTPLHLAVNEGFEDGVKLLLERGIDVNVTTPSKLTPLYMATILGKPHIFQLLLEKGAALNIVDSPWKTAVEHRPDVLHWLEELDGLKTVKIGCWSLYDVLSLPIYRDPVMVANLEMAAAIHSNMLQTEFPNYAPYLKKYFSQAEERYKMINEAQEYFFRFLPNEIQRMILSFLSNEDLTNYIRANVKENRLKI